MGLVDVSAVVYPDLPVSGVRDEVLGALDGGQVVVVVGDTGSGKTTQLPKMALEWLRCSSLGDSVSGDSVGAESLLGKVVGCTQPRRIAAASVAGRVGEELGVGVGGLVGYQVRFEDRTSKETRIKFMTDGILLAESQGDVDLSRYGVLIIDEAHERSLNIDFLLGYLKQLLERRKDLRVIISSATLDAGGFSKFFDDAPVIDVEGRTFPVEVEYLPAESGREDMARHVGRGVEWIRRYGERPGDILVFLPGEREIRDCVDLLEGRGFGDLEILPLFARLGLADQQRVFGSSRGGRRRVVLATNVAETSLTIPGIVYVIDTGVARVSRWNPGREVQRLQVEPTSQASANQRKGRCGRVSEGTCLRLYAEEDFEERDEFTDPEIRRSSLAGVILRMKSLGLAAIEDFPFLDPPSMRHIAEGYRTLREIGALDDREDLTRDVGRKLARIPVEPRLGKMLLESVRRGCLDEVLVLVSGLSVMDPKERPGEKKGEADAAHKRWDDAGSDFLSILNLWVDLQRFREGRRWRSNQLRKFCRVNFLNFRRVQEWGNLHHELAVLCRQNFRWRVHGVKGGGAWGNADEVHKSLLAGMPRQIGFYDREARAYKGAGGKEFAIFPGSGVFGQRKPEWILAYDMVDTSRLWARRVAKIDPRWVEEVAGHLCKSRYYGAVWDKGQGAVYGKEIVTCAGLRIVDGRRVHYGKVDPVGAREVFIRDGLLGGGLKRRPEVLERIDGFREEVRELEQKLRRVDGIWSEEAVFEFFDERIPAGMCTAKEFWRWESNCGDALDAEVGDFVYEDLDGLGVECFPDTLAMGGDEYAVYYRVAPGEVDDGVTLGVHVDQLATMEEWIPEWGVPGDLEERAFLMVKALPKSERVACNPAREAAEVFAGEWRGREPERGFFDEYAAFLSRRSGRLIDGGMFKRSRMPEELVTKVWVCDDEGNEVGMGTSVRELREGLGEVITERFEDEAGAEWEMSGMREWECGELPAFIETGRGRAFPALLDEGDGVGVKVFADAGEAGRSHLAGLVRLFLFRHGDQAKFLVKEMPMGVETKMYLPLLGKKGVNQGEVLRAIVEGVFEGERPRCEEDFVRVADAGRGELFGLAEVFCGWLGRVIEDSRRVEELLGEYRGDANYEEMVEDVEWQLGWLLRDGFVGEMGWQGMRDYVRFFRGMVERVERWRSVAIVKDLERMDRVHAKWAGWVERWEEAPKDVGLVAEGIGIEELRLREFVPHLR